MGFTDGINPEEAQKRVEEKVERFRHLIKIVPDVFKGSTEDIINWIDSFLKVSSQADSLSLSKSYVYKALVAAGYKANDCAGDRAMNDDRNLMGRYMIGQVMNSLQDGMIPEPFMFKSWMDDYKDLPDFSLSLSKDIPLRKPLKFKNKKGFNK